MGESRRSGFPPPGPPPRGGREKTPTCPRSPPPARGTSARRPGPASPRSAISPTLGPTNRTPSACSSATLRRVAGCSHMRGFMAGRHQHGLVGGHQHAGGEVVGVAARHLRQQVGGGRRHHDQVGLARQADVADLALVVEIEQLGEDAVAGQRADRQRRDELLRRPGQDRAHADGGLAQAADQLQALVGGNAAADDQHDARGRSCLRARRDPPGRPGAGWPCRRALCRPS